MHSMGIYNGAVLRSYSKGGLISAFGKMGVVYYDFARGIDDRPVVVDRERKSVGCERTLEEDLSRRSLLSVHLYQLVLELVERLRRGKFEGNVLTLKVKFSDFTQITRSRTVAQPLTSKPASFRWQSRCLPTLTLSIWQCVCSACLCRNRRQVSIGPSQCSWSWILERRDGLSRHSAAFRQRENRHALATALSMSRHTIVLTVALGMSWTSVGSELITTTLP